MINGLPSLKSYGATRSCHHASLILQTVFGILQLADFSIRSIQALTIRLNEFKAFLKSQRIRSVKKITYQHLINFVADHKNHSNHFNQK